MNPDKGQAVGLLGGTFNPIHYGHLLLAEEARIQHHLDRVLFIPNFIPPHRQLPDLASAEFRYEMATLAIKSNPNFSVSDIELKRKGPSYTVDTVLQLKKENPENRYFLISGADSFTLHQWREFRKLLEALEGLLIATRNDIAPSALTARSLAKSLASGDLDSLTRSEGSRAVREKIKVENPGLEKKVLTIEMDPIPISSTEIRERIRNGLSIRYRLPESVEAFIERNLLYR